MTQIRVTIVWRQGGQITAVYNQVDANLICELADKFMRGADDLHSPFLLCPGRGIIDLRDIVCVYTSPFKGDITDEQRDYMRKIAKLIDKQSKSIDEGEQWRGEDE